MLPKKEVSNDALSELFASIYDEYFVKIDNKEAIRYLELIETIESVKAKILAFKMVLAFHYGTPSNIWDHPVVKEIRNGHIELLNKYLDEPIDVDADFLDELERTITVTLSIAELEQKEAEIELEEMRKSVSKNKYEFYEDLESINQINKTSHRSYLTLAEYVAAKKSAIRKAEKNGK